MTVPTTATFKVHPTRVDEMLQRVDVLLKQADKVGAVVHVNTAQRTETRKDGSVIVWTDLSLSYTPVVLPGGWNLAGLWDVTDAGVFGTAAPDATPGVLHSTKERAVAGRCDHCQTTRARRYVYVLSDDTGSRLLVVGSSCLKDFLGVSPSSMFGWLSTEKDFDDLVEASDAGAGSMHAVVSMDPTTVVATALAVTRVVGYVSKTVAREHDKTPTATYVSNYLFGSDEASSELREEVGPTTDEDIEQAAAMVKHFAVEPADVTNDYLFTLHLLCEQERVPFNRSLGYLVSIPSAFHRSERKAVEKAQAAPIPVNGERITVTGEVVSLREVDSEWGLMLKGLVVTEAGWKVWGSIPKALRGEVNVGSRIKFDAKVEPSNDDATFGWFNRPTKASLVG